MDGIANGNIAVCNVYDVQTSSSDYRAGHVRVKNTVHGQYTTISIKFGLNYDFWGVHIGFGYFGAFRKIRISLSQLLLGC